MSGDARSQRGADLYHLEDSVGVIGEGLVLGGVLLRGVEDGEVGVCSYHYPLST